MIVANKLTKLAHLSYVIENIEKTPNGYFHSICVVDDEEKETLCSVCKIDEDVALQVIGKWVKEC